jgi:hypothetical protein
MRLRGETSAVLFLISIATVLPPRGARLYETQTAYSYGSELFLYKNGNEVNNFYYNIQKNLCHKSKRNGGLYLYLETAPCIKSSSYPAALCFWSVHYVITITGCLNITIGEILDTLYIAVFGETGPHGFLFGYIMDNRANVGCKTKLN